MRVGSIFIAPAQVVFDGARKQLVFLQYHGNGVAQRVEVVLPHIHAADGKRTARYIIKARDQLYERRFGRACTADDTDRFTRTDMQVDVVQRFFLRFFGIGKVYVCKADVAVLDLGHGVFGIGDVRLFLQDLGNSSGGGSGNRHHREHHGKHHQAHEDLHGIGDQRRELPGRQPEIGVIPACDDRFCAKPGDQDHAGVHAKLHQRGVKRDDTLALGKVTVNAFRDLTEFFDLAVLLIKGFDHTDTADVFFHNFVEFIIGVEHTPEHRQHGADNQKQQDRKDREDGKEDQRNAWADAESDRHGENKHHRPADRHARKHLEGVLHVGDIGRKPCYDRRRRKLVDVGKRKGLYVFIHILAQIGGIPDGGGGAPARRQNACQKLHERKSKQQNAVAEHDILLARLDPVIDQIRHIQRDHDLENHFQDRTQNCKQCGLLVFPQTACKRLNHGSLSFRVWDSGRQDRVPPTRRRFFAAVRSTALPRLL